ncbi:hypothetical protein [Pontibacter pamirensis]|uniref:hypothetical protein n=1 Tax=Pontibacter pamirensis TaxID=2562824 RepID=UPI00138A5A2C|nr:hypothetical protein [Pontibacter pamirensis]
MYLKENILIVLLFYLTFTPLAAVCGGVPLSGIVQSDSKAQVLAQKVLDSMCRLPNFRTTLEYNFQQI